MCVERKETISENLQRLDDKTPSTMSTMTPQLSFNSPFSPHLRCCMLWPVCLFSRLVGHHSPLGEPFAWMTCSKYEQLFSKWNVMITKKLWRSSSINCCARNRCRAKVLTRPPYRIKLPSTLIEVERQVFVYEYIHNRITLKLSQYSLKNVCLAIVLMLVLRSL